VAAVATPADRQPVYRPRGPDPLRTLFRRRFPDFQAVYEQRYAAAYDRFRLPLITRAASAFRVCGDWSQGIARIRCPSCGFDRFRPFSCKSYLPLGGRSRDPLRGSLPRQGALRRPALRSRAPASWYGRNATADPAPSDAPNDREVDALCRRRAWTRLLAKVHAIDVLACPRCGSRMSVIGVIRPSGVRRAE
jgi:DNA-directed RNA polymerase subunit RPC12/RpoP